MTVLAVDAAEGVAAKAAASSAASSAAASSAASSSAGASAVGKSAASPRAAAKAPRGAAAGTWKAAPKRGTAAYRAQELVDGGSTPAQARRALQDELGASPAEAGDLVDATDPVDPAPAPGPSAGTKGSAGGGQSSSALTPKIPRSLGKAASAGGGALLGAIGYVLALTYLRGGSPAVVAWFKAKFLNRVTS